MIRIVVGMFILMGSVGHDEYMMELGQPEPLSTLLIKAGIGVFLMWWGVWDNRDQIDSLWINELPHELRPKNTKKK